jgi:cytochrome c oxidase subunit 4
MHDQSASARSLVMVYVGLLLLTAISYGISRIPLAPLNLVIALAIAFVKAALVAIIFMNVRYSPRIIWVVLIGSIAWLALLIIPTLGDYMTRGGTIHQHLRKDQHTGYIKPG